MEGLKIFLREKGYAIPVNIEIFHPEKGTISTGVERLNNEKTLEELIDHIEFFLNYQNNN